MSDEFENVKYHPQIEYIVDKMPPNEFVEDQMEDTGYIGTQQVKEELKDNMVKIDFLIDECQKQLDGKEFNGVPFSEYKPLAEKKCYCQMQTTKEEEDKMEKFEEGATSIEEESIAGTLYKRLLMMKKDTEIDITNISQLQDIEDSEFSNILGEAASMTADKD
jgi:hypothetical protein